MGLLLSWGMHAFYHAMATITGALIGSFLNVVIHRLPRGQDMVVARSACPACRDPIPFYLNVPVLAWLALRGRCRACRAPIHWRYPVVEVLMAAVFWGAFPAELTSASLYGYAFTCAFASIMVCHFFIDLEHRLLLDKLNLALLLLVLPHGLVFQPAGHWFWGAVIGLGGPFLVAWAFYKLKGQVGLGGGDIKLWGVLGFLLGPRGIVENIFWSCMLGSLVGIGLMMLKRYDRSKGIPFGPFIIVVSLLQLFSPSLLRQFAIF